MAEDLSIVRAASSVSAASNNCPVLTKQHAVLLQRGVRSTVEWVVRGRDGLPLDLSEYLTDAEGYVVCRFADAITPRACDVIERDAEIVDAATGVIHVELPGDIVDRAGIWDMSVGVYDEEDTLLYVDRGLLSVERGLFGDISAGLTGPPTLQEIRMQLRDTMLENNLNELPEFSDDELLFCLVKPLRQWNESPPRIAMQATSQNFPYYEAWLQAVCGELFGMATDWYRRNKFQAAGAGINDNALDKSLEYAAAAQQLRDKWMQWMLTEKRRISALEFSGSFGSSYDMRS